jgi:hypothetical protein
MEAEEDYGDLEDISGEADDISLDLGLPL